MSCELDEGHLVLLLALAKVWLPFEVKTKKPLRKESKSSIRELMIGNIE